ncbi:LOW QUALITY PROTEIN: hypothetical protein HID58_071527 [Brassica napus]|uniref:Uncharacterized protein n=1 Tax=Brassica napus TaxID=3708 RepID=A0ABQ7Z1Z6_BRANA|nr:LOW QUALITY PROTEIN: hypothetical protein HID58_071527 [Brassica napus]
MIASFPFSHNLFENPRNIVCGLLRTVGKSCAAKIMLVLDSCVDELVRGADACDGKAASELGGGSLRVGLRRSGREATLGMALSVKTNPGWIDNPRNIVCGLLRTVGKSCAAKIMLVFLLRHPCEDSCVDELVRGADACDGKAASELGGGSLRVGFRWSGREATLGMALSVKTNPGWIDVRFQTH